MQLRIRIPRRAKTLAILLIAPLLASPLHGENFGNLCRHAENMFTTGPASRVLPSIDSDKNDFPILIYDMKGVKAQMALEAAQSLAETKNNELTQAKQARAKLQATHDALPDGDPQQKALEATIALRDKSLVTTVGEVADAEAAVEKARALVVRTTVPGGRLYWLEARSNQATQISNPGFLTPVFTTEKVLVLICNATFGDGSSMNDTVVAVNVTDQNEVQSKSLPSQQVSTLDRLYVLDASKVKNNSLHSVNIILSKDKDNSDTLATVVLARHKMVHFSAGGGLLVINGSSTSYTATSFPTTITTVTTQNSTTVTGGVTTASSTQTSSAITSGTASYALAQRGSPQSINAVAGVTFYPFGYDTFPLKKKGFGTVAYSTYTLRALGLFVGTSANAFGNFTVAPAYEISPGVQLYAGLTMRNKTSLLPGVVACSGFGTSPSFAAQPPATTSSTSSSTSAGVTTVITNSTSTTVSMTSGCSNGDKASIITATSAPTRTETKPAFSFGILFNTNLLSHFTGFGK